MTGAVSLRKGTEGWMPSWMSCLPISTADISAAAAAELDDLVRTAASIAVMTVHGLSATTSGALRRKMRSLSTLLALVWLLLVSYRQGSRFRGFPSVRKDSSAVPCFRCIYGEVIRSRRYQWCWRHRSPPPPKRHSQGVGCALADEGVTMSYKYRTVRVRGTELVGTIARKHGSAAEIYETSKDLSTSVVPVFFEATGEIRFFDRSVLEDVVAPAT